ncbi:myosin heavy chain, skeletal muscle-like [Clytia hemisphaerica]|uniref:Uncharacterized protein n=1 Tax=Clytia hemisphaerica TaxID=252671 RepID=A0A7M5TZF6_9CNID
MIMNSKILDNLDVSRMRTCHRCPGSVVFLTEKDFTEHNNSFHGCDKNQHTLIVEKLRTLAESRQQLHNKLQAIKKELKSLYKNNAAKKTTVDLLYREISALKTKIRETDADIVNFKTLLKKEEQQQAQQLVKSFKEKIETECKNLYQSVGHQQPSASFFISDEESMVSDVSLQRVSTTERRLSSLEQKVSEIDILKQELVDLRASIQTTPTGGNAVSIEILQKKSEQLDQNNNTISNMKDLLAQKQHELDLVSQSQSAIGSEALEIKSKQLEETQVIVTKLKELLAEKQRELELVNQLNAKHKACADQRTKESLELHKKLKESVSNVKELTDRNEQLSSELTGTVDALQSAESTIIQMSDEKKKIQKKLQQNEEDLKDQQKTFNELKHDQSATVTKDFEGKIQLLEDRLQLTKEDLENKIRILEQQDQELENAYNGQTILDEQIRCLCNEKDILNGLIEELKAEKQDSCGEWEAKLKNVEAEQETLSQENQELVCQLQDLDKSSNEQQAKIEQLNLRVNELQSSKLKDGEEIVMLTISRDGFKEQLTSLKETHNRCFRKQEEMKLAHEKAIQDMRRQMEQILAEELGTTQHLESKLEEQKRDCRHQISKQEEEISSKKKDIEELSQLLEDSQNQNQQTLDDLDAERSNFEEVLKQLRKELLEAKESTTAPDDSRVNELESILSEMEARLAEISEQKDQFVGEANRLKNELSDAQRDLEDLTHKITALTKQQNSSQEEHAQTLEVLKEKYEEDRLNIEKLLREKENELESVIESRDNELQVRAEKMTDLQCEVNQLKEQLQVESQKAEELKKEKDSAEEKVNSLQEASHSPADDISSLKDQIENLEDQLREAEKKHEEEVDSFKLMIEALEKENTDAKAEITSCKGLKKDNDKLNRENKSMMLDLFEKKELNGLHKNEITLLKNKVKELETKLRANCAPSDRVIDLSKELLSVQEQCNDAIVECDVMSKQLKTTERELANSRKEVEQYKEKCKDSNKSMDDSQVKFRETQRQLTIKTASEERLRRELDTEQAKTKSLEGQIAKLRAQMQNGVAENLCSKAVSDSAQSTKAINEQPQSEVTKDEGEDDYSSSFDDDIPSSSASSSVISPFVSIKFDDQDVSGKQTALQNESKNDNGDDESLTEDETSLLIDTDDEDVYKFSDVVQTMPTQDKTKLNSKDVHSTNYGSEGESDGVSIPKREWGECFINNAQQSIDEDVGEICEESVASLSSDDSMINEKSQSSSEDILSGDGDSNKISKKKTKKDKKKKSSKKQTKALAPLKALPPLKAELPALKGKPILGDLPVLHGAPLKKTPSTDECTYADANPAPKNKSLLGGLLAMSKNRSNDKLNTDIQHQTNQEDAQSSNISDEDTGMSLLDLSKQATTKISRETLTSRASSQNIPIAAVTSQSSKQNIGTIKSQKSNILGDLPPLPGSKSSVVMKQTIPGVFEFDNNQIDEDDASFGDDDIDALLGDLDDFDAKRTKQ